MPPKKNLSNDGANKKKMVKVPRKKEAVITPKTARIKNSPPKSPRNPDEDEAPMWDLGKQCFVRVDDFLGHRYVHIRYYYYKDGQRKPSRAGIALTVPTWKKFMKSLKEVNEAIKVKCAEVNEAKQKKN